MARETIASVKARLRKVMSVQRTEHEAAIDRLVNNQRTVEQELRKQLADKNQALEALRVEGGERNRRIDELLTSNNGYQAEARAARAEVVRVQAALSDAARVIHALGQRPE